VPASGERKGSSFRVTSAPQGREYVGAGDGHRKGEDGAGKPEDGCTLPEDPDPPYPSILFRRAAIWLSSLSATFLLATHRLAAPRSVLRE